MASRSSAALTCASDVVEADIAIVGSGAAAGVMAHRLVADGHRVVMVERGRHEDPASFSEDEAEMLARLYRDGAVQLARDFRLQVLQGMCVGGTTVINNAVSIRTPPEVVADWDERCGGALTGLESNMDAIVELLDINTQPPEVFAAGVSKFVEGVEKLELEQKARVFEPVAANIRDCLGCGYCNIGCAYGRKLSMLDTLLPQAQEMGPGELRIVSECAAEGIEAGDGRVEGISCRANGSRVRVRADRYVVAAGAVGSSYLLGRSGVGGAAVGQGLGFNIGSPITAEFDERLDNYAGLQITHVYRPRGVPDYVMETWFNPVLSQALAMPGWFYDHRRNMLRYAYMAATGVIVGSASNASVEKALLGGADVVYTPEQADLERVLEGLKLAGRIYLEAGAKRVMPATFEYHSFTSPEQLDQLTEIVKDSSRHPARHGPPAGRQRPRHRPGHLRRRPQHVPRPRDREPLPLRRLRLPDDHRRQPAAHRDGPRAPSRAADLGGGVGQTQRGPELSPRPSAAPGPRPWSCQAAISAPVCAWRIRSPSSPVRIRIASSTGITKIFPSPTSPVLACLRMVSTTMDLSLSSTTTSILSFGRTLTVRVDPR